MLSALKDNSDVEAVKLAEMVNQVKFLQREKSKLERMIKIKLECIKQASQKDKLFKIMLRLNEVQEYMQQSKFLQSQRDALQ